MPTQAEVEELFHVVDVAGSGEVGRAEMAAALIDWRAFKVGGGEGEGNCAPPGFWLQCTRPGPPVGGIAPFAHNHPHNHATVFAGH